MFGLVTVDVRKDKPKGLGYEKRLAPDKARRVEGELVIPFRSTKLSLRLAPELTGPWSSEVVVYNISKPWVNHGHTSHYFMLQRSWVC